MTTKTKVAGKTYTVTRMCCQSAHCFTCLAKGVASQRKRVVQGKGLTKVMADRFMHGWKDYEPALTQD